MYERRGGKTLDALAVQQLLIQQQIARSDSFPTTLWESAFLKVNEVAVGGVHTWQPSVSAATYGPARGLLLSPTPLPPLARVRVDGLVDFNALRVPPTGNRVHLILARRNNPYLRGAVDTVLPLPASGQFSITSDVVFAANRPTPEGFEGSIEIQFQSSQINEIKYCFKVITADCGNFIDQVVGPWELGETGLEFLDSLRQVFLSAPIFQAAVGRYAQLPRAQRPRPLAPKSSAEGRRIQAFKDVRIGDEIVDISHVLIGIEGASRQDPQPKVPIQDWRADLYLGWAGDLGSAVREWAWEKYYLQRANPPELATQLLRRAGRPQLLGDLDGVNLGAVYDQSLTLSMNLERLCSGRATRRRFRDFLKNTLTDSGTQAIKAEGGAGRVRLTAGSQAFIAEYILRFAYQSFLLNIFDKDRAAYVNRKFGSPTYVPPEVVALLRPDSPEILTATRYFVDILEAGLEEER